MRILQEDRHLRPEWGQAALMTIDTQVDFLDDQAFPIPGTIAALPGMARLLAAFRRAGRPIVHIVRLYKTDGSNVDICRRTMVGEGARLAAPGSPGSELAAPIRPDPGTRLHPDLLLSGGIQSVGPAEEIIYKPRWGAFYQTPLESRLTGLGITTIVFCGCNYPNCPRTSIYEASERDFRLVLAHDAISGLDDTGAGHMRNIGVSLLPTEEIVAAMAPVAEHRP